MTKTTLGGEGPFRDGLFFFTEHYFFNKSTIKLRAVYMNMIVLNITCIIIGIALLFRPTGRTFSYKYETFPTDITEQCNIFDVSFQRIFFNIIVK